MLAMLCDFVLQFPRHDGFYRTITDVMKQTPSSDPIMSTVRQKLDKWPTKEKRTSKNSKRLETETATKPSPSPSPPAAVKSAPPKGILKAAKVPIKIDPVALAASSGSLSDSSLSSRSSHRSGSSRSHSRSSSPDSRRSRRSVHRSAHRRASRRRSRYSSDSDTDSHTSYSESSRGSGSDSGSSRSRSRSRSTSRSPERESERSNSPKRQKQEDKPNQEHQQPEPKTEKKEAMQEDKSDDAQQPMNGQQLILQSSTNSIPVAPAVGFDPIAAPHPPVKVRWCMSSVFPRDLLHHADVACPCLLISFPLCL